MTEQEAIERMRVVLNVFLECVKAGGEHGALGDYMHAAIADRCTRAQFDQIMGALVRAGKVRKSGQLYFAVQA